MPAREIFERVKEARGKAAKVIFSMS